MKNIYKCFRGEKLSSPYRPECNGLVKRSNGTLKSMLRKFAVEVPEGWDRHIPNFLFAYREVHLRSTRFSPFELLYGHSVRGLLQILCESWTDDDTQQQSVIQHVMEM